MLVLAVPLGGLPAESTAQQTPRLTLTIVPGILESVTANGRISIPPRSNDRQSRFGFHDFGYQLGGEVFVVQSGQIYIKITGIPENQLGLNLENMDNTRLAAHLDLGRIHNRSGGGSTSWEVTYSLVQGLLSRQWRLSYRNFSQVQGSLEWRADFDYVVADSSVQVLQVPQGGMA